MKKGIISAVAMALTLLVSFSGKLLASGNDTLVVYANGPSLDAVINSDTTTTGLQAHSVYKLVSLDTTYIFLGPATIKSSVTIIGVPGSDGRLPCIQPGVLSNGSVPSTMLSMPQKGVTVSFEDLYILELSTKGTVTGGTTFQVAADSVRLYLNNVIDEENQYMVIEYSGSWDDFFITNCIFRNGVNEAGDFYTMQLLSPNLYLPIQPADSVVMDYNTFFCTNGGSGGPSYANYLSFCHNTVALAFFGAPPGVFGNGKIDDNIFYGVDAGGESKSEFTWMDDPYHPEIASVIDYDTMSVLNDSLFDPVDWGKTNFRMLAEAKRNVQVENNIYFMPKAITDYQKAYDDTTASADSIYTPGWMNPRTTSMFNDKTDWPGFTQSGNLVGTDPGYGSSLADVYGGGTGYGVGLLDYIGLVGTGTVTTQNWGYQITQVGTSANWIPTWPLAEKTSGVLTYSAVSTAPDGKPYGDPYWFTGTSTPESFSVLSGGDSYTSTPAAGSSYPDPKGTKLTDGTFAPDTGLYSGENMAGDPAWVGFLPTDTENVVINLGKVMSVQQFMGDYLLDPPWGIYVHHVNVSVSTDGATFTTLDSLTDSGTNDSTASIHKFYLTLASPVQAQYVEFSTIAPKAWVFVDEYEVLGPTVTAIRELAQSGPSTFALSQNYPNPFNPSTTIQFTVAHSGLTSLRIYNVLGQLVATVYQGMAQAHQSYNFNVSMDRYASGVYFYTLQQGSNLVTKKMLLLK